MYITLTFSTDNKELAFDFLLITNNNKLSTNTKIIHLKSNANNFYI